MKKILILILFIYLYAGFSTAIPDDAAFNKEHLSPIMYKILGMLSEYNSRWNVHRVTPRNKNIVEYFYPREKEMAVIFEQLIKQYQNQVKKNFNYSVKTREQGHIYFYSEKLTMIVNSFYMMKGKYATLNPVIFSDAETKSKLAFLEGVYLRFGCENSNLIRMYNAMNKVETIGLVLKFLGCKNILIYTTKGLIPNTTEIIFEPTEAVKNHLNIDTLISREHVAKKKYFQFHKEIK